MLRLGHRIDPVPNEFSGLLVGTGGLGCSTDPAADMLGLEATLRRRAVHALAHVEQAEREVAAARTPSSRGAAQRTVHACRGGSRNASGVRAVSVEYACAVEVHEQAQSRVDGLRQFIIGLDMPSGALRAAATGWQRSPAVPTGVTVIADVAAFLALDPRRAANRDRATSPITGETFGEQWRREGDDDATGAGPPDWAGPWTVGYIHQTREVYALRRAAALPDEIWVLAAECGDPLHTRSVLSQAQKRMSEPNSLIAAVDAVSAASAVCNNTAPRSTALTVAT